MFKVGDEVKLSESGVADYSKSEWAGYSVPLAIYLHGGVVTNTEVDLKGKNRVFAKALNGGPSVWFEEDDLILANKPAIKEDEESSALDKRKNGKIRMELVDQGFPLALMELGRVMTWANENKGYKDHDWKQLPDAENGFKGAAARHRVKFDAQRAFGNEMLDCVDEESGIIHLAHEAFNVLALLELALAGRVK